jgi:hypothetical protein
MKQGLTDRRFYEKPEKVVVRIEAMLQSIAVLPRTNDQIVCASMHTQLSYDLCQGIQVFSPLSLEKLTIPVAAKFR